MLRLINNQHISNTAQYRKDFQENSPFRHLMLANFFKEEFCKQLLAEFPPFNQEEAKNEMKEAGGKHTCENVRNIGNSYQQFDSLVSSSDFLKYIEEITDIDDLIYDKHYFGAGTHENLNGQNLFTHVDFNYHPTLNLHRRLNIILYLNTEWEEHWGGTIDLHSDPWEPYRDQIKKYLPIFNSLIIFETNHISWHGFSEIKIPDDKKNVSRKSLTLYLYSNDRPSSEIRPPHTTHYVQDPIPQHFKTGYTLTEEDAYLLQKFQSHRNHWMKHLYEEEMNLSAKIEFAKKVPFFTQIKNFFS